MSSHADDEPQVVHMLAVDGSGEANDDEDEILHHAEEIMLMHAQESMGNGIPPPLFDMDEEPLFVMPTHPPEMDPLFVVALNDDSLLGDSFIFGLEDGIDDFAIRSENHVIPVINDDEPDDKPDEPAETASTLPQSQISRSSSRHSSPGNIAHKEESGLSESEKGQMPNRTSPQPVMDAKNSPLWASALEPVSPRLYNETNRRNSAPVIPTLPSMEISPQPPTMPKDPITLETPRPSESSKVTRVEGSSSSGLIWGMSKPVFFILAFYLLFVTVAFAYFVSQYVQIPSLGEEIEYLDAQVNLLEEEQVRLEKRIVDLNSTIGGLSAQVANLTEQNEELTASNLLLQEEISYLQSLGNGTNSYQDTVANLTLENERLNEELLQSQIAYAELINLTQSLNETNAELEEQVANLTSMIVELEGSC